MPRMAAVHIEHLFNCSEDTFWNKVFFDDEYNDRMFKEALSFPVYKRVKFDDGPKEITRVIDVVPKMADLPGPLKKLVGDNTGYRENGRFDKQTQRYELEVIPNKLADKLTIKGVMFTEPAGEGKCKRVFDAKVEARIFGVGGMLEKRIVADMEQSYGVGAKFTNAFIAEKGL